MRPRLVRLQLRRALRRRLGLDRRGLRLRGGCGRGPAQALEAKRLLEQCGCHSQRRRSGGVNSKEDGSAQLQMGVYYSVTAIVKALEPEDEAI